MAKARTKLVDCVLTKTYKLFASLLPFTFTFIISHAAIAIATEQPPSTPPPEYSFVGGLIFEFPVYSFYFGSPNIDGRAYVPNVYPRIGPRISYKKVGLRTTFALPLPDSEERRRGETEQSNTILSFFWRQHAFDLYFQYFKGFYLGSPILELRENRPDRYSQLPNAESTSWGFNWYYNISPTQFGLNSAFDQTEFKVESGSGWVLIPFYRHWTINLGDTIIKGSKPNDLDTIPEFRSGRFDTLGASYAYARTWEKQKNYISSLFGVGPALQFQKYQIVQNNHDRFSPALKFNLNFSVGHKHREGSLGANFILDSIVSRVSNTDVYSSFVSGELFFNSRF